MLSVRSFNMPSKTSSLLVVALAVLAAGCGGNGGGEPRATGNPGPVASPPAPNPVRLTTGDPAPVSGTFTFHPTAPHARHLAFDAQDQAQPTVTRQGHRDSAAVLVYAEHRGRNHVLLARRAPWLSEAGTWSVFMGSVEATDLDSAGSMSYARAAEHELYEESVTVYHDTDANALRALPTHMKTYGSGLRSRTFFAKLPYHPEKLFNDGFAFATRQGKPRKFLENDQFRWVLLDELKAASAPVGTFKDAAGTAHTMTLYSAFARVLVEPAYKAVLNTLP